MFIFWHGFGFLVAVFYFVAVIAAGGLFALFGINDMADGRVVAVSLLLAAAPCWFLGRRLLHHTIVARTPTGETVRVVQPHHSLFFVPMHWWGVIFLALGIVASAFNFGPRLATRSAGADWVTFSPPSDDFTVAAPATLVDKPQTISSAAGSIERHRYYTNSHGSYFAVERWDYPTDMHFEDRARALDGARDGAIKATHGRLLEESAVMLGRLAGRQVRISIDSGRLIGIARLYLVEDRLYDGIVVRPSSASDGDALRFLDSLHITGE